LRKDESVFWNLEFGIRFWILDVRCEMLDARGHTLYGIKGSSDYNNYFLASLRLKIDVGVGFNAHSIPRIEY